METDNLMLIEPRMAQFVETPQIHSLVERALRYLDCGLPVNFSGPPGTGKTTLALHVAARLGQPVVLVQGDDEYTSRDLVGGMNGFRHSRVVDNFIHSVLKTEENMSQRWVDSRLAVACRLGYTLVYDEFTRSKAEANNVLLSVLQERILPLPATSGKTLIPVHPNFKAIFTSNPEEYAGVNRSQEALKDRMISLHIDDFDQETEAVITASKSGLPLSEATMVVELVRALRRDTTIPIRPSARASIAIARVIGVQQITPDLIDQDFYQICLDILGSQIPECSVRAELADRLGRLRLSIS